jgi:hypothetical protein
VNVDCCDKQNAKSILFDVVTQLQTNDLSISAPRHRGDLKW